MEIKIQGDADRRIVPFNANRQLKGDFNCGRCFKELKRKDNALTFTASLCSSLFFSGIASLITYLMIDNNNNPSEIAQSRNFSLMFGGVLLNIAALGFIGISLNLMVETVRKAIKEGYAKRNDLDQRQHSLI